jgi:hypothetical protein
MQQALISDVGLRLAQLDQVRSVRSAEDDKMIHELSDERHVAPTLILGRQLPAFHSTSSRLGRLAPGRTKVSFVAIRCNSQGQANIQ